MKGENQKADKRTTFPAGKSGKLSGMGQTPPPGLSLMPDQWDLVLLRDELYDGSWDDMLADLKNRMAGKPYIFKLVNRIQQDIAMIENLRALEKKKGVNLRDLL